MRYDYISDWIHIKHGNCYDFATNPRLTGAWISLFKDTCVDEKIPIAQELGSSNFENMLNQMKDDFFKIQLNS